MPILSERFRKGRHQKSCVIFFSTTTQRGGRTKRRFSLWIIFSKNSQLNDGMKTPPNSFHSPIKHTPYGQRRIGSIHVGNYYDDIQVLPILGTSKFSERLSSGCGVLDWKNAICSAVPSDGGENAEFKPKTGMTNVGGHCMRRDNTRRR